MKKLIKLSSGFDMPVIGLGTWQSKTGEVGSAVKAAIEAGYRHIDTAYIYRNEAAIGSALKEVLAEGKLRREDLFITSKLWQTRHHAEDVKPSLQESLDRLGVTYLDLYLIHSPLAFQRGPELLPKDEEGNVIFDDVSYVETWKAMEACVDQGLVRSIGLSNFNSRQIQQIIDDCRIRPAVLQVEIHPYFQQEKLVNFCHERNIAVTSYSSFCSPGLVTRSGPLASLTVLDNECLQLVAGRHGKTVAQIVLRWLIQRNIIVIPKSVTPARIHENIQVFDFELSDVDMEEIKKIDTDTRLLTFYVQRDGKWQYRDKDKPNFPFNDEF